MVIMEGVISGLKIVFVMGGKISQSDTWEIVQESGEFLRGSKMPGVDHAAY